MIASQQTEAAVVTPLNSFRLEWSHFKTFSYTFEKMQINSNYKNAGKKYKILS